MPRKHFLLTFFAMMALMLPSRVPATTVFINLISDSRPYRILPGAADNYWIVDQGHGLILLTKTPPDVWSVQYFSISGAFDATGPDPDGRLFVSVRAAQPSVKIFDTNSRAVVASIPIYDGAWHYPNGLALSTDYSHLYVCAPAWPAVGEFFSYVDSGLHPDSGRVYDIDLATNTISRTAVVGALPQTIHLSPYNELLVSADEMYDIKEPVNSELVSVVGQEEYVDIIDLQSFTRMQRIACNSNWSYDYTNDLAQWNSDGRYVAVCNPEAYGIASHPAFSDAIWIIDTADNSVSSTIGVIDSNHRYGAKSLIVSDACTDGAYVAINQYDDTNSQRILLIDKSSGEVEQAVDTGTEIIPEFLYELPDGRLIVTGGVSGKLAIIDPT